MKVNITRHSAGGGHQSAQLPQYELPDAIAGAVLSATPQMKPDEATYSVSAGGRSNTLSASQFSELVGRQGMKKILGELNGYSMPSTVSSGLAV